MTKYRWTCPKCAKSFVTEIDLKTPPTCYAHSGKVYQMVLTTGSQWNR